MPLQREAMAELLADLLLDHDLIDAQVELLLPLSGVHWRVLDGIEPGQFEQVKPALADLPWPLQPQESYTALTSLGAAGLIVPEQNSATASPSLKCKGMVWIPAMNRCSHACLCCRTPLFRDGGCTGL